MNVRAWLWLAAALLLRLPGAQAQVSVSASGSPTYGHAISVPPGIGGMSPNLSLVYSGGGVNGPVGHGWSVQGISMITRCPASRYTDGAAKGVVFGSSDKLCLDGQRLIQTDTSGAPATSQTDDALGLAGSQSREYRTEKDSFARIRAYGTTGTAAANGPLYFKVWTKAGQIYEYGASPNATATTKAAVPAIGQAVVMVWAVSRISDVVGNFIDFKYEQRDTAWGSGPTGGATSGREWNILEIQYTGNGTQAPANKVSFQYSDRTVDRAEAYQQGSKNISIRRLWAIDTFVNSQSAAVLVKRVRLAYDNSGVTKRSRLVSIKECADAAASEAVAEIKCQPPVRFSYSAGGNDNFVAKPQFNLGSTELMRKSGKMGVEVGDFNGDGKADLLRWSDVIGENRLYLSVGNGSFNQVPMGSGAGQFNITSEVLISSNGCYSSLLMDFNGDGLTDIFRYVSQGADGLSCAVEPALLFLSKGDGSFDRRQVALPPGVTLKKNKATPWDCLIPGSGGQLDVCTTRGDTFYVVDVDGDALPDLVTTWVPEMNPVTTLDPCASTVCTQVLKGDGLGGFSTVFAGLGISNKSLYQWPSGPSSNAGLAQQRYVVDLDGNGLADIVLGKQLVVGVVGQGAWRSLGNGDFETYTTVTDAEDCKYRIDFNGDGRGECLWPSGLDTGNRLTVSTGTQLLRIGNFNLAVTGGPGLIGSDKGVRIIDLNGDGLGDILHWRDDATLTRVYLSNGDGTFTLSSTFDLNTELRSLVSSDGVYGFVAGDFSGNGSLEILRLRDTPTTGEANTNQVYVKNDTTLPDQLLSVVSPSGLKTTLTYGSLAGLAPPASAVLADLPTYRYFSDRRAGTPAVYPLVDLTVASPVVITAESEIGVGSNKVKTEFAYRGLKAALDGRGMLGFRQAIQQNTAPNGQSLSVITDYLLDEPYAGVARRAETRLGSWNSTGAQLLSSTVNTYCDTTSATSPDSNTVSDTAPCISTAKVRRPYVRKTVETGADLLGKVLPTVTTVSSYDNFGNPSDITVTTKTTDAMFPGVNLPYTKATANIFCLPDTTGCPNKISGDNWILGRLMRATVTSTVPNLLSVMVANAGTAVNASAIVGNQVQVSPTPSAAKLAAIMQFLHFD